MPVAAPIRRSKMQVQIIESNRGGKLHFTTATHIMFKKLPYYCAPSAPDTKENVRNTVLLMTFN